MSIMRVLGPDSLALIARGQAASRAVSTADTEQYTGSQFPWIYPPPGFEAFDFLGAIPIPAVGSESVVISFQVPPGRAGAIKRLSWNVTAPGFVQGSGDLVARVAHGGRAVKNYDAILVEMGSPALGRPTDGILLDENEIVQLFVMNVAFGALAGQIVGSLSGYYWPK
jgi:hypothetical protein